jgi:hypothetical protein
MVFKRRESINSAFPKPGILSGGPPAAPTFLALEAPLSRSGEWLRRRWLVGRLCTRVQIGG